MRWSKEVGCGKDMTGRRPPAVVWNLLWAPNASTLPCACGARTTLASDLDFTFNAQLFSLCSVHMSFDLYSRLYRPFIAGSAEPPAVSATAIIPTKAQTLLERFVTAELRSRTSLSSRKFHLCAECVTSRCYWRWHGRMADQNFLALRFWPPIHDSEFTWTEGRTVSVS